MTKPSFAGRGLLERARSTTFALLGITAAMGLGLVALVSQQSVISLPALPLPGLSAGPGKIDDARVVAEPSPLAPRPVTGQGGQGGAANAETGKAPRRSAASGVAGSRQLAVAPTTRRTDPATDGTPAQEAPPASAPAPLPPSEPASAAPASEPSPATPPATTSPPGKSTAVVDGSEDNEDGDGDEDTVNAGGRQGGKPGRNEPPLAPTPPPDGDDVSSQDESSDEVEVETPENDYNYRGKSNGRGHGYGRFGK